MMAGPLIAVVAYHLPPGRVKGWESGAYAVHDLYVDAVRRAGGVPMLVPPGQDGSPEELLEPFDGLLLVGGGDVEPKRYGAHPHPETKAVDRGRDELEISLVRAADASDLPTLAVCRGAQVTNVAFGGTLVQHLPDDPGRMSHQSGQSGTDHRHEVKIADSSRLAQAAGAVTVDVVSRHHQGIERVAEGLIPVAWSDDGLIEAVERAEGWTLAVQWHPEVTAAADRSAQALFDALVQQARRG
jgi:gamma-glutamyl-gamma-aminobutyrate hydrolase PuuD